MPRWNDKQIVKIFRRGDAFFSSSKMSTSAIGVEYSPKKRRKKNFVKNVKYAFGAPCESRGSEWFPDKKKKKRTK